LSVDQHDIIQCASCGQRMRVPAGTQSKVYKCVKCGALVQTGHGTPPPVKSFEPEPPPKPTGPKPIADLFVDMGLANREQIDEAQEKQQPGEKLFETLLRLEMITKDVLHAKMSKEGHAAINLSHFTIDRDLTELVPLEVVRKHWVLPMSSLGKSLTVAMVCPVDMEAFKAVEEVTNGMRIRAMVCKIDDFLAAVRKHYRMPDSQDVVSEKEGAAVASQGEQAAETTPSLMYPGDEAIRQALSELERLPIPSRVMNQVDAVVGVESEGLRQVVSVVGNSPSLAAIVLCTANSTAYGLSRNVDSIPMAITLVGEQAVSVLAANAPKLPMANEAQWKGLTHFSRHCAEIAAVLAIDSGKVTPNVAYCAGLLHALGSYALGTIDPEEYSKIPEDIFGEKRLNAEKQVFGMGYNEAGALLCEHWGLPEVLVASLRYSLTPEEAGDFRAAATVVYIASNLAGTEGEINQEGLAKCANAMKSINVDPAEIAGTLGKPVVETANTSK
jgi:HD-like signal output (HDOD) protein